MMNQANTNGATSTDLEAAEPEKRCRTCGDVWGDLPDNHHFGWIRWDQFRRHVEYSCCDCGWRSWLSVEKFHQTEALTAGYSM